MQNFIKTLLLTGLALGVTWAAGLLTGGSPPGALPAVPLLTAAPAVPAEPAPPAAPAASPAGGPATEPVPAAPPPATEGRPAGKAAPEVTREEMNAELQKLERTLGNGVKDPGETAADKPLPADLPVALPSDI